MRKESFSAALVTSGGKDSLTLQRDLRGLIGKRLVIGSVGSGTNDIAPLLAANGITRKTRNS